MRSIVFLAVQYDIDHVLLECSGESFMLSAKFRKEM